METAFFFGRGSRALVWVSFLVTLAMAQQTPSFAQPGLADLPSASREGYWESGFGLPRTFGGIQALASDGSKLVAGGWFTAIGGTPANGIAQWDGTRWHALGVGLTGSVAAVVIDGSRIFIGGRFEAVGGRPARNVAMWDGQEWHPLGAGITGEVRALALMGRDLIVGGRFSHAGGLPSRNVAHWSESRWQPIQPLGSDTEAVNSLAVADGAIFAGGTFKQSELGFLNCVAQWRGWGWLPLGGGLQADPTKGPAHARSLAVHGGKLYVGGMFNRAGEAPARNVAMWDGDRWSAMGGGLEGEVTALASTANGIVAAASSGSFPVWFMQEFMPEFRIGGTASAARWNGFGWEALGTFTESVAWSPVAVDTIVEHQTTLSFAGNFLFAETFIAEGLVGRQDGKWKGLGNVDLNGIYGNVTAISIVGTNCFVLGNFNRAGNIATRGLVRRVSSGWASVEPEVDGQIYSIFRQGTNLWITGPFTTRSTNPVTNLARWTGDNWVQPPGTPAGTVWFGMATDRYIYIAGVIGPDVSSLGLRVARWDGVRWVFLPGTFENGRPTGLRTMVADGESLYVGGDFTQVGGITASNVVQWDDSRWRALGLGVAGIENEVHDHDSWTFTYVAALALNGTDLYAAGSFIFAGGKPVGSFARWDGRDWDPAHPGISGLAWGSTFECDYSNHPVRTMILSGDGELYVGGSFWEIPGVIPGILARREPHRWAPLGAGISGSPQRWSGILGVIPQCDVPPAVHTLASADRKLYVGGVFAYAGNQPSHGFAIWHEPSIPRLRVSAGADSIALSWPSWATNFTLEATQQIASPQWSNAGSAPTLRDGRWEVTLDSNERARFYRLKDLSTGATEARSADR